MKKNFEYTEFGEDITWLHTGACKYNLSALGTYFVSEGLHIRAFKNNLSAIGTYFESEGVDCIYLSFT